LSKPGNIVDLVFIANPSAVFGQSESLQLNAQVGERLRWLFKYFLNDAIDGLCRSVPVQRLRLGPIGRSVHGICYGVPDFMASKIALLLEHVSLLSSEFARGGSMAGLQEPGLYQNCFVLRRKPH
jgi:hypothetical protein